MMLMVLAAFPAENVTVPMKVKLMLLVPPSHLTADHGNILSQFLMFLVFCGLAEYLLIPP